jgi:hypothetical protein
LAAPRRSLDCSHFRLLRNSTKIAAQFLGLGQCSQKAPETGTILNAT